MSILITNNTTVDLNIRFPYISVHVSFLLSAPSKFQLFVLTNANSRQCWPFLGKKGQNGESKMEDPITKRWAVWFAVCHKTGVYHTNMFYELCWNYSYWYFHFNDIIDSSVSCQRSYLQRWTPGNYHLTVQFPSAMCFSVFQLIILVLQFGSLSRQLSDAACIQKLYPTVCNLPSTKHSGSAGCVIGNGLLTSLPVAILRGAIMSMLW